MKRGKTNLPDQRDYKYALNTALEIACNELSYLKNIEEQCRRSGAGYSTKGGRETVVLKFLNKNYGITRPDVSISIIGDSKPPEIVDRLLVLHYFLRAKGSQLTSTNISFRELPEGSSYYPSFYKRAVKPLIKHFGDNPDKLVSTATVYDAKEKDYGDASVIIKAFERVPITLILWRGDSEFNAEGSVLFDSTISDYLPTEDIAILCQILAYRLIASSKE